MPKDKWNKDCVAVLASVKVEQLKDLIYHYCILSLSQAMDKYNQHSTEFPRQFCHYYLKKTDDFCRSQLDLIKRWSWRCFVF